MDDDEPGKRGDESSVEEADEDEDDGVRDSPRKSYTLEQELKVILSQNTESVFAKQEPAIGEDRRCTGD